MAGNFMKNEDAIAVLTPYANKIKTIQPQEITWEAYQQLTAEEKAAKRYLITDYPEVSGECVLPVNPADTTNLNIWIVDDNT